MPRRLLSIAAAVALCAPVAQAQMTDAERADFRAEVRAYLLENPEVIFEAVAEFERRTAAAQSGMDATLVEINAEELFFDSHSWVGGNPDGDITLVEFMDYRCTFCQRAFPEMMTMVEGDGNVRLVIKELPILGPQSEVMSRFAVSVLHLGGPDPYFVAHERLLAWQGEVNDTVLGALAVELGLDAQQVLARMRSQEVTTILAENRALAQRLQISGTPTFAMGALDGGELLRGMLPATELAGIAARLRE